MPGTGSLRRLSSPIFVGRDRSCRGSTRTCGLPPRAVAGSCVAGRRSRDRQDALITEWLGRLSSDDHLVDRRMPRHRRRHPAVCPVPASSSATWPDGRPGGRGRRDAASRHRRRWPNCWPCARRRAGQGSDAARAVRGRRRAPADGNGCRTGRHRHRGRSVAGHRVGPTAPLPGPIGRGQPDVSSWSTLRTDSACVPRPWRCSRNAPRTGTSTRIDLERFDPDDLAAQVAAIIGAAPDRRRWSRPSRPGPAGTRSSPRRCWPSTSPTRR